MILTKTLLKWISNLSKGLEIKQTSKSLSIPTPSSKNLPVKLIQKKTTSQILLKGKKID